MNREFILWQMTFPEMMLYYSIGVEQHLKLSGLFVNPGGSEPTQAPILDEKGDHRAIYEYYHNRHFDPSTWPDEIQRGINGK